MGSEDLRIPDDTGQPLREEVARMIYCWDAVTDEDRTRDDYRHLADSILVFVERRRATPNGPPPLPG